MSKNFLFDEFNEISSKAWKQKIQFDLKGAEYNDALVWESPEGIKVKPFYHKDEFNEDYDFNPQSISKWLISESIYVNNANEANNEARRALKNGSEHLIFTIDTPKIEIKTLLEGINLEKTTVHIILNFLSKTYVNEIQGFAKKVCLNIDIIGHLTRTGNWYFNFKKDFKILEATTPKSLYIDAVVYQNAGANKVQELSYALAHANEYLVYFDELNLLSKIKIVYFKIAIGGNYFFEIAKLRALRRLWQTLIEEYNLKIDIQIIAVPTNRNKTLYNFNANILRSTTECMSAVLGGANIVCNATYNTNFNRNDDFGKRIARNQLLMLQKEGQFGKVANPADGAYYVENISNQLAEKALLLFKNIESSGGFLKLLRKGTVQNKISESAQKEQKMFDEENTVLIGINKYQNSSDSIKSIIKPYSFSQKKAQKTSIKPIQEKRLSENLEIKRLKKENEKA